MAPHVLWTSILWALAGAGLDRTCRPMATRLGGIQSPLRTISRPALTMLATAVLFGLLAWRIGVRAELLAYSCVALAGVSLAAVDIAELRLPSRLIWAACIASIVLFALAAVVDGHGHALFRAAAGMIGLPAAYLTLALLSRGGLGAGDIRLAALVGLALAWRSWTALATGTLMAFGYACVAGLVAITLGQAARNSPIPFGPAMIAGAFTVLLAPL